MKTIKKILLGFSIVAGLLQFAIALDFESPREFKEFLGALREGAEREDKSVIIELDSLNDHQASLAFGHIEDVLCDHPVHLIDWIAKNPSVIEEWKISGDVMGSIAQQYPERLLTIARNKCPRQRASSLRADNNNDKSEPLPSCSDKDRCKVCLRILQGLRFKNPAATLQENRCYDARKRFQAKSLSKTKTSGCGVRCELCSEVVESGFAALPIEKAPQFLEQWSNSAFFRNALEDVIQANYEKFPEETLSLCEILAKRYPDHQTRIDKELLLASKGDAIENFQDIKLSESSYEFSSAIIRARFEKTENPKMVANWIAEHGDSSFTDFCLGKLASLWLSKDFESARTWISDYRKGKAKDLLLAELWKGSSRELGLTGEDFKEIYALADDFSGSVDVKVELGFLFQRWALLEPRIVIGTVQKDLLLSAESKKALTTYIESLP